MSDFESYKYEDSIETNQKIKRLIWNIFYYMFFRSNPNFLFNNWRIFLLKLFGAKIGKGCVIYPTSRIWEPWNLEMGDFSVIAEDVDCYCVDKIIIGSKVAISQRSYICTASHDISSLKRPLTTAPIIIKDHAWICAESFIGPNCIIEEGSIVAARSVVTKNTEKYSVVGGNPAKFIKDRIINKRI